MVEQQVRRQEYLPIDQILVDESKYQFRAAVSLEVAENYAALIAEGYKFPNIVLFDTKREDDKYVLVEGFQRFKAYQVNNYRKLHVDIIEGSEEDAIEHAMKSNTSHGQPYTHEDKRKILRYVFGHSKLKRMTDNNIAKRYGFSQGFVSSYRKKYEIERGIEDEDRIKIATTKDGREYPVDTKKGGETRKKNGTDKNTRKKPVIPKEQEMIGLKEIESNQLELGESVPELELDTTEHNTFVVRSEGSAIVSVSLEQGITYTNESGSVKVTFDELDKVTLINDVFDLIIYSGDLDWLVKNQSLITSNKNVIIQGFTGEDITKLQNLELIANNFNLFIINRRMIFTAYFCSKLDTIQDQVLENHQEYLSQLIYAYLPESSGTVFIIDPSFNVVEIMQQLDLSVHVFYSEQHHGLAVKELNDCNLLEIELILESDSDQSNEDEPEHF